MHSKELFRMFQGENLEQNVVERGDWHGLFVLETLSAQLSFVRDCMVIVAQ